MNDSTEPIIRTEHLSRSFGPLVAVRDVSLEVRRGEIFGILGPNGAGKSTTIRMLCGILDPTGGTGTVVGFDIARQAERIKGASTESSVPAEPGASPRCSSRSAWQHIKAKSPEHSQGDGSSASPSRVQRSMRRRFSFSTSQPPASIPSAAASSGSGSMRSRREAPPP